MYISPCKSCQISILYQINAHQFSESKSATPRHQKVAFSEDSRCTSFKPCFPITSALSKNTIYRCTSTVVFMDLKEGAKRRPLAQSISATPFPVPMSRGTSFTPKSAT